MPVDVGDVGHDLLPVGPLDRHHLGQVEAAADSHGLRCLEGDGEVPPLLGGLEAAVGDLVGHVAVQQGGEGHAIVPRGGKVGDVHLHVAGGLGLAPLKEGVPLAAAVLDEGGEGVTAARLVEYWPGGAGRGRLVAEDGDGGGLLLQGGQQGVVLPGRRAAGEGQGEGLGYDCSDCSNQKVT